MTDYYLRSLEEFESLITSLQMPAKTRQQLLGWVDGTRRNLGLPELESDLHQRRMLRSAAERVVIMSTDRGRTLDEIRAETRKIMRESLSK